MSEYARTTRECSVDQLHPELLLAIQIYFKEHGLGDLQIEALRCCETISRKKNTGTVASMLGGNPDTTIYLGMLLTSQWLIWVHSGDKSGTRLNAANLNNIRTEFYTSLFAKDVNLLIDGFIGDANSRIRGRIAMGAGPAAQKFCEEVIQAVSKVNPPAPKKWLGWPMG